MLTQLCKTTHPKLLVGKCPWCGLAITNGQLGEIHWETVQKKIRELIAREDKSSPLTDQEIVELLAVEGIHVPARTVTKSRHKWRIPPAKERRAGNP